MLMGIDLQNEKMMMFCLLIEIIVLPLLFISFID